MSPAVEREVMDLVLAAWLAGADPAEAGRVIRNRYVVDVRQLPALWQMLNLNAAYVQLPRWLRSRRP